MKAELYTIKPSTYGVAVAVALPEIRRLIDSLERLEAGQVGHFNLKIEEPGDSGIADIEFTLMQEKQ